ncbi:hypothetical protein Bca52824_017666 [Brassica carinata]|uniref:Uncharacterized protein n=1 Tax=Brassica carinata TaxID=52824 RepID=A0A8X8AVM1_BRACI|nr:hypothetical protein Bca52824_017666 [Brassica carinata]
MNEIRDDNNILPNDLQSRVCLSVFNGLAKFLSEKFAASGEKPKVVVPTNINPKLVGVSPSLAFLKATSDHRYLCLRIT